MKANKAEQQALVTLLNRIYGEIRAIEEEWDIRGDANDFRPRVEYFHDAVRALTAGGQNKRLSVELLAYDIGMLRHIQANPLKRPKGANMPLSAGTDIIPHTGRTQSGRGDASVKSELADHYKSYAVLFAALLCDAADRDYQSRISECNAEVEDSAALEQALKITAQKKDVAIDLEAMVDKYVDDPGLAHKILHLIHDAKQRKRVLASEALRKLKDMMAGNDKEIKTVEQAHFTYVTSQLAVYEMARDVVKKMATSGMNIVGNFVESAVAAARGQRTR